MKRTSWRRARQGILLASLLPIAGAGLAQSPPGQPAASDPPAAERPGEGGSAPATLEVEVLIRRVQEQIERMNAAASERDRALRFLEQQIEAAAGALSSTGETASSLRSKAAELDSRLESVTSDRAALATRLEATLDARDQRIRDLEARMAALDEVLGGSRARAGALEAELGGLKNEIQARSGQMAGLEAALRQRDQELDQLRTGLAARDDRLEAGAREVRRLTGLLDATGEQLRNVMAALDSSETTVSSQQIKIDELGTRLNAALTRKVEELERYRSEFFGRLRRVLGDRPDIRTVGDRFVLPSELLFSSGSARLDGTGEAELAKLAQSLRELSMTIPADIDWVLRVDGHTDRQPVRGDGQFRSNWDLSSARAIAVVEYLIRQGIPPARLAATGFGEFRPLDPADGEDAYRRNRRIELKLTEG